MKPSESSTPSWVHGTWKRRRPTESPGPGGRRSTFEWHPSGENLLQRTVVDVPEAPNSLSIMGCDAANDTCFQLYSDERGVCRVFEMNIGAGEWKLWRLSATTGTPSPDAGISRRTG
jgi:hypothetical protein